MKLVIAIFEGADFDILSELMSQNLIPNMKKIHNFNKCKCSLIPYEAAGLMSAFSGIPEKEHAISSYWKPQNNNYVPKLWESVDVKEKMIWKDLKEQKTRTTVLNLWGTHPVFPIDGYMLSYSMRKSLRYSYPDNLLYELMKNDYKYVQDTCVMHGPSSLKETFCNDVIRIDALRHNCIKYFENKSDVIIVNYTAIDRIAHFYFNEFISNKEKSQLYRAYKQCDMFLADLIELVNNHEASLIVFSEIGFGPLKKFIKINKELQKEGFLKYKSDESIDWENTIAFESVQGSHGININLRNRNIYGKVNKYEYGNIVKNIVDYLITLKNPDTQNPYFKSVLPREECYKYYEYAPDIILEPYDEQYLPYGDPYWSDFLSRDLQTGWHRKNGFYGFLSKQKIENKELKIEELYQLIKQHI